MESSVSCLASLEQCQEGILWVNLKNLFHEVFGIVLVCGEDWLREIPTKLDLERQVAGSA